MHETVGNRASHAEGALKIILLSVLAVCGYPVTAAVVFFCYVLGCVAAAGYKQAYEDVVGGSAE